MICGRPIPKFWMTTGVEGHGVVVLLVVAMVAMVAMVVVVEVVVVVVVVGCRRRIAIGLRRMWPLR